MEDEVYLKILGSVDAVSILYPKGAQRLCFSIEANPDVLEQLISAWTGVCGQPISMGIDIALKAGAVCVRRDDFHGGYC
jgi:hypothetical protein